MVRKKIEFLMKPIPGKTYEVGDTVTILQNYLPGTCEADYRCTFTIHVLNETGGKVYKIVQKNKTRYESSHEIKLFLEDEYWYKLSSIEKGETSHYCFSASMFKESYRYDKKKD